MKKFHTGNLLLGLILLTVLIWEIGPGKLWQELVQLGGGLILIILIEGGADLLHAQGWRHCLSGRHRTLSFFQAYRIRLVGSSINYLTPTAGLGGEVTKGTLLSVYHKGPEAATGVIIGKLSYALSQLFLLVLVSVILLPRLNLPAGIWTAMLAGSIVLGTGIFGFLIVQKYGKLGVIVRWLSTHRIGGRPLQKISLHITQVDLSLKQFYEDHPKALPLSMLWHMGGLACGMLQIWYFLYLLTDNASFITAAGIWFLGSWMDLVGFAIPINIGVQEAKRVIAFKLVGLHSALGLTYGVTLRLEQLFWAGAGLAFYASLLAGKRRTSIVPKGKTVTGDGV
jgi:hypothetical protein